MTFQMYIIIIRYNASAALYAMFTNNKQVFFSDYYSKRDYRIRDSLESHALPVHNTHTQTVIIRIHTAHDKTGTYLGERSNDVLPFRFRRNIVRNRLNTTSSVRDIPVKRILFCINRCFYVSERRRTRK